METRLDLIWLLTATAYLPIHSARRKGDGLEKPEYDERLGTCVALLTEAAEKAADRWYVAKALLR